MVHFFHPLYCYSYTPSFFSSPCLSSASVSSLSTRTGTYLLYSIIVFLSTASSPPVPLPYTSSYFLSSSSYYFCSSSVPLSASVTSLFSVHMLHPSPFLTSDLFVPFPSIIFLHVPLLQFHILLLLLYTVLFHRLLFFSFFCFISLPYTPTALSAIFSICIYGTISPVRPLHPSIMTMIVNEMI